MSYLGNLIDSGDLWPTLMLIFVLHAIGKRTVEKNASARQWGLFMATALFAFVGVLDIVALGAVPSVDETLGAVLFGLSTSAIALGPIWMVLSVASAFLKYLRASARRVGTLAATLGKRLTRRRASTRPCNVPTPAQIEAAQEAESDRLRLAEEQEKAANRRESAIAACEILYHLRAPEIATRFPQEKFDAFIKQYMAPGKSVEAIDERAAQLQGLIHEHYQAAIPPERFASLAQLADWYEKQNEQISDLAIDGAYKAEFKVQLNSRYADLTQQLLERL